MELSLTIPRDDFDTESFGAAAGRFAELVGDHEQVRINVTTEFVTAVREVIVDDPEYAEAYEQNRELAFALAKTITQADGSVDLIVDAGVFSAAADPNDALRTFEHEALHVVVERRDESLNDLRTRCGQSRDSAAGTHSAICGVACEEYRVERALWGMHPDAREHAHLAQFETLLGRFEQQVRDASVRYQRNLDVGAICRSVMEAFHAVATSTAYVAAEIDGGRPGRAITVDPELDRRLLGGPWHRVVAALRALPAADKPTPRDELERVAVEVGAALEEWLEHLGFALTDLEGGELHFAVLNPGEWVSWSDLW